MKTQSNPISKHLLKNVFNAVICATAFGALASGAIAETKPASAAPTKSNQTVPAAVGPQDSTVKEKLTDKDFVEKATLGSMSEIEISKLATEKSSNKKIKQFAATMVKDHEKASAQLKQVAAANRIDIPTKLDAEHQKVVTEIKSLSGASFDEAYVALMKKDHDKTVGLFDNAAGEPSLNAELRVFANKTLPTLRNHQKHAHALIGGPLQASTAKPKKDTATQ